MKNSNEEISRASRNKKRQSDRILNWLIGVVVIGIVVMTVVVLSPDDKEQAEKPPEEEEEIVEPEEIEPKEDEPEVLEEDDFLGGTEEENIEEDEIEIIENPNDAFVSESMIDPGWTPIGTEQSGEHVSLYDGTSVDWKEKEQALLCATGLTEDNVIFKRIKNGGSPHKSIGIVTSLDSTEKYRVYLEWIDGEGWKPTQLDVLNTLDFNY